MKAKLSHNDKEVEFKVGKAWCGTGLYDLVINIDDVLDPRFNDYFFYTLQNRLTTPKTTGDNK